jgi:uncharacterized protein YkwD
MHTRFSLYLFFLTYTVLTPFLFSTESNAQQITNGKIVTLNTNYVYISGLEQRIFALINQKRIQNGLKPLLWNERVARIARLHSNNMAINNFFSHAGLDGKHVDGRAKLTRFNDWRVISENIAFNRGYEDPAVHAVESWMNSEGHRKNLLQKNWDATGVGVGVTTGGAFYFTQVFIK